MEQEELNKYFRDSWKPDYTKFTYTGYQLINKVQDSETILDVGCGYNLFKPIFGDRLHGIDPANDLADEVVSIEDFTGGMYDVAFVLGSINFGEDKLNIIKQVDKVLSHVKPGGRIYWRQNPGNNDHPWKGVDDIKFFPWSFKLNIEISEQLGCKVNALIWDNTRIYAEWFKE